ncbi:MAG: hypothetical protein GY788_28590 [bacterium]|nr:hypothetical protein [bacterium]
MGTVNPAPIRRITVLAIALLAACSSTSVQPTPTDRTTSTAAPLTLAPVSQTTTSVPPAPTTVTEPPSTVVVEPSAVDVVFEHTFGGEGRDRGVSVHQTDDGGYVVVGGTSSFGAGSTDAYLLRTDAAGDELWARTFGGIDVDNGWSVVQAADGGFVVAGFTSSFGAGGVDVYLFRTNSVGTLLWETTFGGAGDEHAWAIQPAADGGYIIAGETDSFGAGDLDAYLIRVDEDGNELWSQTYGGDDVDRVFAIRQADDGGYVAAGITNGFDAVGRDAYVVKTDASGGLEWERTFGDRGDDVAHSIDTSDDGYTVMGYSSSFGANSYDVYLIRLDESGESEWTQVFGGAKDDRIITGTHTADGGLALIGYTTSFGAGNWDTYLVKTDSAGNPEWFETFGGTSEDTGYTLQETIDGGYILTGYTDELGSRDLYLIKVDPTTP